jgi:hypothetical protein
MSTVDAVSPADTYGLTATPARSYFSQLVDYDQTPAGLTAGDKESPCTDD